MAPPTGFTQCLHLLQLIAQTTASVAAAAAVPAKAPAAREAAREPYERPPSTAPGSNSSSSRRTQASAQLSHHHSPLILRQTFPPAPRIPQMFILPTSTSLLLLVLPLPRSARPLRRSNISKPTLLLARSTPSPPRPRNHRSLIAPRSARHLSLGPFLTRELALQAPSLGPMMTLGMAEVLVAVAVVRGLLVAVEGRVGEGRRL